MCSVVRKVRAVALWYIDRFAAGEWTASAGKEGTGRDERAAGPTNASRCAGGASSDRASAHATCIVYCTRM